jgi:hypothetical protein
LRGLDFKKEVAVGSYSKEELLEFLKAEFEKDLPREKAVRYQRGYAKFGLIPADLDIFEAYMDLFGSAIAGFYHPKTKQLRLIRASEEGGAEEKMLKAMGIDMERVTLVHELTHAAQDQHFELSTLPLEDETNDDLLMAIKSAIEGDASVVGWKYGLKDKFDLAIGNINATYQTGLLPGKAGNLPAYLRQSLTFPYGHGADFVVKYLKETDGDFKNLSKLFADFPLSSEQILHPEKYYLERDNPTLVTLPDIAKLLGDGWKESFNNVHGEFSIRLLLREFKSDQLRLLAINKAAAGWDGDRYVVLENGDRTMYVWYSTWDTEDDAQQFAEAYRLALEKKYSQGLTGSGGVVYVERKGSDVLVFDGGTEAMNQKAATIWKETKKVEITAVERLKKFICEKDGVKEAFSGKCAKCGDELLFQDDEKSTPGKKKSRDYSVNGHPY